MHASWLISGWIFRSLLLRNVAKPPCLTCTGWDRAKSRSSERYKSRHGDSDGRYYGSRRSRSRDFSRKRYALDDIDTTTRHDDEHRQQSTHRSRDYRTRGRSPSPTAVRWIVILLLLNSPLTSEDVCKPCQLAATQRRGQEICTPIS
jgi:hypothetical protein